MSKILTQIHKSLTNKSRQKNDRGIVALSIEEQRFISSKGDKQTDKETKWDIHNYLISELDEVKKNRDKQLAVKGKQLENKDSQIAQMQYLLDQQQRLALQDKKLLEEYKAEIKDLKALAMPSREVEEDVASPSESEPETQPAEAKTKPKKWWRFGKS